MKRSFRETSIYNVIGDSCNGNTRLACMREFAEIETDEAYRDLTACSS